MLENVLAIKHVDRGIGKRQSHSQVIWIGRIESKIGRDKPWFPVRTSYTEFQLVLFVFSKEQLDFNHTNHGESIRTYLTCRKDIRLFQSISEAIVFCKLPKKMLHAQLLNC